MSVLDQKPFLVDMGGHYLKAYIADEVDQAIATLKFQVRTVEQSRDAWKKKAQEFEATAMAAVQR